MLGIVWADGLLTLFVFWELTSITSFLLIGFDDTNAAARAAAMRAFLVTGAGGLAMLAGLIILTIVGETTTISGLLADPPSGTLTDVALVLVLLGSVHEVGPVSRSTSGCPARWRRPRR
jgi:multicomponent Na+:H+ antiporter subunit A